MEKQQRLPFEMLSSYKLFRVGVKIINLLFVGSARYFWLDLIKSGDRGSTVVKVLCYKL